MGFYRGSKIITDGLVLYLDVGNTKSYSTSGTTWYDLSGLNNTTTMYNGVVFNEENIKSLIFDGIDDYCKLNYNNINLTENITVCYWCNNKTTPAGYASHHISKGSATLETNFVSYFYKSQPDTNKIGFIATVDGVWTPVSPKTPTLDLNKWYYIAWAFDSLIGGRIFVNGAEIDGGPTGAGSLYNSSLNIYFGDRFYGGHSFFDGQLSNIKIYNKTLTNSEIQQNYNALKGRFGL